MGFESQKFRLFLVCVCFHLISAVPIERPHIILIVGDDIGYNDVSWNNDKIPTPFMDDLAKNGVILDKYYSFTVCSPSRASLLTGKYSDRLGIQRWVLGETQPYGVPLRFKMLPQKLVEAGYSAHAVGKWHVGYCDWLYTPTFRGFQSWIGFYNGAEENFEHSVDYYLNRTDDGSLPGFDFRDGTEVAHQYDGQYSEDIYTRRVVDIINEYEEGDQPLFFYVAVTSTHFPLDSPEKYLTNCGNSVSEARRKFCASMVALDDEIKNITLALQKKGIYNNSVIIFASDNGATTHYGGNNYPLRGEKGSIYEGGARVPAFVHSPLLEKTGYVNHNLIQVSDWYPTILRLAGAEIDEELDGVDQWDTISHDYDSSRKSLPYLVDRLENGVLLAAVRNEKYKLIAGPGGHANQIITEEQTVDRSFDFEFLIQYTNPYYLPFDITDNKPKLYDLQNDPSESHNLADELPDVLEEMWALLNEYIKKSKPAMSVKADTRGAPRNFNNTYSPGWCEAVYDPI